MKRTGLDGHGVCANAGRNPPASVRPPMPLMKLRRPIIRMNVSVADLVCFGSEFLWNTLLRSGRQCRPKADARCCIRIPIRLLGHIGRVRLAALARFGCRPTEALWLFVKRPGPVPNGRWQAGGPG